MSDASDFRLTTETITLGQLLKAADLASSGGAAKEMLASGDVTVNGETEARRGRQLVAGDIVALADGRSVRLT